MAMTKYPIKRFWEIDFMRGLAIVMMIFFHLLYDLNYFGVYDFFLHYNLMKYFALAAALIFILIAGISLTLSYSRARKIPDERDKSFMKYFKRSLKIFSWGLIITLVTWIFIKEHFVIFGILHFIGISIILAYPFLQLRYWNLLIGAFFISTGIYLQGITFNCNWLVWLGFIPNNFYSVDFFPIFPWFGVVLFGVFIGNILYPDYERKFYLRDLTYFTPIKIFSCLGKYSLFIYLIHQPVLIMLLYFFNIIDLDF